MTNLMNIKRSKFFIIFVGFFIVVISNQITFYYLSSSEYSFMNTKKKSENSNFSNLLNPSNSETEKGNYSIIQMLSISDSGGIIKPGAYYRYPSFIGNNLSLNFILIDLNFSRTSILDPTNQATFLIKYNKTSGEGEVGILANNLKFDNNSKTYHGIIETYILTNEGKYTFEINMSLSDYEIQLFSFNFFLKTKFEVDLFVPKPNQIVAGEKFNIWISASYIDDSIFYSLIGASIRVTIYINNQTYTTRILKTNTQGIVEFYIILPLYTNKVSLDVEMVEEYNHVGKELYNININVIPLQEFLTNLIFYVILIVFIIIVLIFIYYKLIIPKKNKKKLILNEYKQIFKDILKLENLYILHKSSGEFLFYKTYTSEKINSEILIDIKSFISSLNNSMKSQSILKEINYKSKILLLIDGNYVILGVILNKEGSGSFKNYLKECIVYIEALYKNELSNKYVKLNLFDELEKIIEDKLNISVILPHRIEYDIFDKRLLKAPYSKDLYNILSNLIKESSNKYFQLSEPFFEFSKQTGKGVFEFFICIKELKDNNLLTSINKA